MPITSYAELRAEGRRMSNCVETYWQSVLAGHIYFYHWAGDEPASVSVVSDGTGAWYLDEAFGQHNQELREETVEAIAKSLRMEGGS